MLRTPRLTFARLTGPTAEPVLLAEAKSWSRIDTGADDTLINTLITRAREHCEAITHRQFLSATYALVMDSFPSAWRTDIYRATERREGTDILLPRPPLVSVQSIVYIDGDGVSQTVTASDYIVSVYDIPGRIALAYGKSWPDTLDQINAVTISYTAGYANAAAVPEGVKLAILMLVSHFYENREPVLTDRGAVSKELEFSVNALLSPHICGEIWMGDGQ